MDSDEPYLRPCKQLPSPTNDRQIPHSPMGQHLGMQSTHVQIDQNSRESSQEPSTTLEDNEEDLLQSDTDSGLEIAEHAICETNQKRMTRLLKGKDKEWESRAKRKGPLRLLDLPLDVLKIVLKEVCLPHLHIEHTAKPIKGHPHKRSSKLRESELCSSFHSDAHDIQQI